MSGMDFGARSIYRRWALLVVSSLGGLVPLCGRCAEPSRTPPALPIVQPAPRHSLSGPELLPAWSVIDPAATGRHRAAALRPLAEMDWEGILAPVPGLPDSYPPVTAPAGSAAAERRGGAGACNFCWEPHNLYHRAAYFEDLPLERYGWTHPCGLQPLASTAHFLGDTLLWPLRWGREWPGRPHFNLAHSRAGSPAPRVFERWLP